MYLKPNLPADNLETPPASVSIELVSNDSNSSLSSNNSNDQQVRTESFTDTQIVPIEYVSRRAKIRSRTGFISKLNTAHTIQATANDDVIDSELIKYDSF